MDPFETPQENSSQAPGKKWVVILMVAALFLILAALVFYVVVIRGNGNIGEGLRSINPFGDESGDASQGDGGTGNGKLDDIDIPLGSGSRSRMWKIAEGPVSGAVFRTLPDGAPSIRYVVREDGDIHEYELLPREGRLLANNATPRVAEALWDARGQSLVLRTATDQGTILSTFGRLLANSATGTGDEAPAVFAPESLPRNIAFMSQGPTEGFVYTLADGNDLSIMLLHSSGEKEKVFTSPFSEWLPEWPSEERVVIATRPSGMVGGYLFTVDTNTRRVDPVLSDVKGLTVKTAPNGSSALVGGFDRGAMTLSLVALDAPDPTLISPATLPEKCAWTASSTIAYCGVPQSPPRGMYPDTWYQGVARFSDTIWRYSVDAGQFSVFAFPLQEGGEDMDVISPMVSADGAYLIFTNKKDGALWGLELTLPSLGAGGGTQ